MNEALASQEYAAKDDFSKLLPIQPYEAAGDNTAIFSDLDRVITKSSLAVRLHPNSKWVDDCYWLVGKAKYLRGDYDEALAAFQTITSKYNKGIREKTKQKSRKKATKLRKKEEAGVNVYYDPKHSFILHKPARWKAMIWIVKSFDALGKPGEAHSVVSLIEGDKTFPDKLQEDLQIAITELHIHGGRYRQAANAIGKAIVVCKNKKRRVRYTFIQGQLHELAGQNQEAIKTFTDVIEMKPGYEMEFQAEMKIVRLSAKEMTMTDEEIIARLNQMLKNDKYRSFLDEIYFALAEIYLGQNNTDMAVGNFKSSISHSRKNSNTNLQAKAYLQLADIYFERENYVTSKAYHDSTLAILNAEHEDFSRVNHRRNVLNGLVEQLAIISRQDTLLWLATLTPEELALEKKKWEEARLAKQLEDREADEPGFGPLVSHQQGIVTNWPFYDPMSKGNGFTKFRQVWSDRALTDNWRRSQQSTFPSEDPDLPIDSLANGIVTAQTGSLFENIPKTPEQVEASHNMIIEALYQLGYIYKDQLENEVKAAETFEELLQRYPENPYRAEVLYNLYLLFKDSNPKKSAYYKNLLLNEYPESLFATVILNPDFIEEGKREKKDLTTYYEQTYSLFEQEQWPTVIGRKQAADTLFSNNFLKPEWDMLESLSFGRLGMRDTFKSLLEDIVNNYPQHDVKSHALEILHLLESDRYRLTQSTALPTFKYEPEAKHLIVVVMHEVTPRVGVVKNGLADYNTMNHSLSGMKVSSLLLNNNTELVVVNEFKNSSKAVDYYNEVRYNETVFKDIEEEAYTVFAISEFNYGIFFREKDIPAYMRFFTNNYLGNN